MHPILKKIQMKRKMSSIQKLMQISFNGNLPLQAAREFLGSSGPKHSLGPGTATPSIFFFFWLIYSNVLLGPICKSHQLQSRNGGEEQNGHVQKW